MSTMRPSIAERIRPVWGDAIEVMQRWIPDGVLPWPDVVYLDPMFSAPRKTAERRPMRVLRALAGSDPDAAQLVETALAIAPRVVVKRPRHATPLVSHPTVHVVEAKALRFDVYHRPR